MLSNLENSMHLEIVDQHFDFNSIRLAKIVEQLIAIRALNSSITKKNGNGLFFHKCDKVHYKSAMFQELGEETVK